MATFPAAPEDTAVEMLLGSSWVDLVAAGKVRLDDGIRISRGKSSATAGLSAASPSSCTFTLDNRSGDFSPDNPLGAYYGSLERGNAVRVAVRTAKDTFARTTSNGLGTADAGGAWSLSGAASHFSTDGSVAKLTFTAANDSAFAYQATQLYRDHDVAATFTFPFSNVTGGPVEVDLLAGGLSTTDVYAARLSISTAEVMTFDIVQLTSGTTIASSVTVSSFAFTGQAIRMRFQVSGQTLRAKVWPAASVEPNTWHVQANVVTDGFLDRAQGWAGFRAATGVGNSNVTFAVSVDNWEVRINRFTGTVSNLTVESDTSGNDLTTKVECGAIRRRLSQGASPLMSTFTRGNKSLSPAHVAYWPCEDSGDSTSIASGIPGGLPMTVTGTPTFATYNGFVGSAPLPTMNGARFDGDIVGVASTGTVQAVFLLNVGSSGEASGDAIFQLQTDGTAAFFDLFYEPGTGGDMAFRWYGQDRVTIGTSSTTSGLGLNGRPLQVSIELVQNGGNIDYTIATWFVGDAGGILSLTGSIVGRTVGAPIGCMAAPYGQIGSSTAIGQIAVRTTLVSIFALGNQLKAYNGENPRVRFLRVCAENDSLPAAYVRRPDSPTGGTTMGEQERATLLTVLDDCANSDLGTLFESRDVAGFVFRQGRSKWNQNTVLTLAIASGQLAPPFGAVYDDQQLSNDVTVTRKDGSSTNVTQTTGQLSIANAGRYNTGYTLSLSTDDQTVDRAYWFLYLGTFQGGRFPSIRVQLEKLATASRQLYLDALSVDVEDRIVVSGPNSLVNRESLDQLALGYVETLKGKSHEITYACTSALPYSVAEAADTAGDTSPWMFRLETSGATVNTLANAGATTLSVATPSGPLWTTVADDFPVYLNVGGVKVRATACSGAASPQTFTVDALAVSRAAGLAVTVWAPGVLGW